MTKPIDQQQEVATRLEDILCRFSFDGMPIRGQWVRLESTLTEAFRYRQYPPAIANLLSAQLAAVAMFADNLKFQGAVSLQSRGKGPLLRSLAECREQHKLRGIAHLQESSTLPTSTDLNEWIGAGQLALSLIDKESGQTIQQAMIELADSDLATNLEGYFQRSEQLPTLLFFAHTSKSVTGLLLQRLPHSDSATEMEVESDFQAWEQVSALAQTLRGDPKNELATLAPAELLTRLFHEFSCRIYPPRQLTFACTCSRAKSDRTLLTLGPEELDQILDELGHVQVDCEFCGTRYSYDSSQIHALKHAGPADRPPAVH